MTYFNIKTCYGVETIDELDRKDFASYREFRNESRRLLKEYHIAGINAYRSSRCTKDWKKG